MYSVLFDLLLCIYNLGSPKRVLHSLKSAFAKNRPCASQCLLQNCCEDDLLCTRASPSPLQLLSSGFGIHPSSLNKSNASDGSFKLPRYISGPDVYTVKIFQYFWILEEVEQHHTLHLLVKVAVRIELLSGISYGPHVFNAATNATSGQTENVSPGLSTLPAFGRKYDVNSVANEPLLLSKDVNVSDSSILGYPRAPAFGVPSNSHVGTPRFDSYSFGQPAVYMSGSKGNESTTPLLKSSGFGKSAFGINQKGSRTTSYIASPEIDSIRPGGANIQSICGMQTYQDKSHDVLRFEDYQLGDKGTLASNAATNATSGQTQNISPGSSTLQTFGKKYDVNSVANEPLMWSRDANVSGSSIFGSLKPTSFGVSSNSHFGTPRFDSYSFGQAAVSMSGSKGLLYCPFSHVLEQMI
ncbi:nuclear pore complex protein NUP98A-like [Solanum dulcamara]|uniref:nuclear pore complex protein NUP98A-like n=1 Tax=Solanum dulcamara TaxID=45834 RepID=UPI00248538EA|nr:nuclear pore complex protein NUP98A-like [Solanum dulcamara]